MFVKLLLILIEIVVVASHQGCKLNFTKSNQPQPYVLESAALLNGKIPVKKYKTSETGLTIVIANTEGPLVNGYLCLATKAHDDNGLPHCLEHLIFCGSEDYPYKGALNLLSSRCSSPATNAFTGIDRTCYTSSHIAKDGFLTLLPIFIDHLLYPILEPPAFLTEVYHVNGEGLDGGVLYSEMEAHRYDKNKYAVLNALYKDYGYGSYNGGALKNLRENTTNQMAVAYHKQFYRPENLCITICGDVNIDEVMTSIEKMERKILSKPKLPKWERPWKAVLPDLDTVVVRPLIPSGNEGYAEVYIAWRGPNCATEYRKLLACSILLSYLCASAVAGDTFAKGISSETFGNSKTSLFLKFTDVVVEKTDLVYPKVIARLQDISQGIEKIDQAKIKDIIEGKLLSFWNAFETSPHDTISQLVVNHFLYGSSANDFQAILNGENDLNFLLTVPDSFWIELLNEYFINKKYVQSIGIPSRSELDRLQKEDKERMAKRLETLGDDGLRRKSEELAAAIAYNSRPLPESIINSVPMASLNNTKFHDVKIYRTNGTNEVLPFGLDVNSWPIYAEAYDCRTKFVYVTATFSTDQIQADLRPYIYLVLKLIHDLPIQHKDPEVLALNNFRTINKDYRIGLTYHRKAFSCGLYSQTATFTMQVQNSEYEVGVKYLIAKLQNTVLTVNNIRDAANALLYYVSDPMTDAAHIAMDLLRTMYYKSDTNTKSFSVIHQKRFLTSLIAMLDDDVKAQQILEDMNNVRNTLVSPENLAMHVTADFTALHNNNVDMNAPWQRFSFSPGPKRLKVVADWEVMVAPSIVSSQGEVIGLNTSETVNFIHSSPAMTDFNDKDLAPLTVALSYFSQMGGPMWSRVRGRGYTYIYALELIPDEGVIQFQLLLASNIIQAVNETLNIINEAIQPDAVWEQNLVDSAKTSAIFEIVNRLQKFGDIPLQTMLLSFQKVSSDYNKNLITEISAVTIDDLKRVTQLYLTRMFSASESKTAIVCKNDDAQRISQALKTLGFDLPVRYSWDESLLGQF